MRRLFAILLFALLLGVGVIALIETDPGYVLVAYGNYTLETSLWVGLLLLLALVLLVYFVMRLVFRLVGGQRSLVSWLGPRKTPHASRLSTRGLVNFIRIIEGLGDDNYFQASPGDLTDDPSALGVRTSYPLRD